jgi:hypothetical protein
MGRIGIFLSQFIPGRVLRITFPRNGARRSLLTALLLFGAVLDVPAGDEKFAVMRAGGKWYTNAVVTGKSKTDLFIVHAQGFASVKVKDLDSSTLRRLGYLSDTNAASDSGPSLADEPASLPVSLAGPKSWWQKLAARLKETGPRERPANAPHGSLLSLVILIAILVGYLSFSRSCADLCRRAGAPSSVLVWLPGLKALALFKAMRMSWLWFFLGVLILPIGLFAWVVCCARFCETFHRSKMLVLPMLLPVVGWLVFMYMARNSRDEDSGPGVRDRFTVPLG